MKHDDGLDLVRGLGVAIPISLALWWLILWEIRL